MILVSPHQKVEHSYENFDKPKWHKVKSIPLSENPRPGTSLL